MTQPPTIQTAEQIAVLAGKSTNYVRKRLGLESRHLATTESATDLALSASLDALGQAGIDPSELAFILAGYGTPDQVIPYNAALLQGALGPAAKGVPAMDVGMTCLSSLAALHVAEQCFRGGLRKPILIASADIASVGLTPSRTEEFCLFGDGAAAMVVSPDGPPCLTAFETHGDHADLCQIPAGGSRHHPSRGYRPELFEFRMQGPKLYRLVLEVLPPFLFRFFADCGISPEEIDWLVPHQASMHGVQGVADSVRFPAHRRIDIFATHGNQVSASIPTALHRGIESGRIRRGQKILLAGTSAGVSMGAALFDY